MNAVQKKLLNLFLLGFVGALAGGVLFYQLGNKAEKEVEEQEARRVLPAMTVVKLTLSTPEAHFELERQEQGWHVVAPIETAAEETTVDGMVKHLVGLEHIREVGSKRADGTIDPPDELWLFALEPPRFTVSLTDEAGETRVLQVGKKNAFDGSIYVKLEDASNVIQVDGALEYQVDKTLYQLRDKRLFAFVEDEVTRLAVRPAQGAAYVLGVAGGEYSLLEPLLLPADRAQATGMISALANVRAQEFVSERATAEELERYALAAPSLRLQLTLAEVSLEMMLARQRVGSEAEYYATRGVGYPILKLSSDWVFKKLNVSFEALRDKRVLRFEREAVRTLTLSRQEAKLVFERRRDADDTRDEWHMLAPQPGPADDATLAGILYRLGNLKAKAVLDEEATDEELDSAGLTEPEIEIELGGVDGGALGRLRFTKELHDERLVTSGRRIDLVEASVVSDLSFEAGDYREATPPE